MSHPFDYRADAEPVITNQVARDLHGLVAQLREAERDVVMAEARLETAETRLRYIREVQLPEALGALGTERYRIPEDGTEIELADEVLAWIPADKEDEAHEWFEKNDEGGLIKRTVVVAFNKDQEDAAKRLLEELRPKYAGVKEEKGINSSTLRAWAKRRHEEKKEIPACVSHDIRSVAKVKGAAGTPRKYKKK